MNGSKMFEKLKSQIILIFKLLIIVIKLLLLKFNFIK